MLACHHARQVMLGDVGNFMAEHSSQFRFALHGQQQPAVHADKTARHGKGVNAVIIKRKKLEPQAGFSAFFNQPVTEPIEVIIDLGIVQELFAGANLHHALLADLALLQRRKHGLRDIAQIRQPFAQGAGRKTQ